jgi:hypothetical protein
MWFLFSHFTLQRGGVDGILAMGWVSVPVLEHHDIPDIS